PGDRPPRRPPRPPLPRRRAVGSPLHRTRVREADGPERGRRLPRGRRRWRRPPRPARGPRGAGRGPSGPRRRRCRPPVARRGCRGRRGRALFVGLRRREDPRSLRRAAGGARMTVAAILFWVSVALIAYTHLGYPLLLAVLTRLRSAPTYEALDPLPKV